jgi:hypothetical protein
MGAEATCAVTFKGKTATARVRLETDALQIRGRNVKVDVPLKAMKTVVARNGSLVIGHSGGALTLRLGAAATRWADKILHPPSRLTKIGARPEWRTIVVGDLANDFVEALRAAVDTVSVRRKVKEVDAVFVGVSNPSDFKHLLGLKALLKPGGALWLIRPKGSAHVTEAAVMAAGKAVGLIDVKVVAFSSTHSALKFVIPVKDRRRS